MIVGCLVVGVAVRSSLLLHLLGTQLDPDGRTYLDLARDRRWAHPFAAGPREPAWLLWVKVTTGPWGYTGDALRVTGFVVSCAGLWLILRLLAAHLSGAALAVAGTFAAVHPLLVFDGARGLREPLTLVLATPLVGATVGGRRLAEHRSPILVCCLAILPSVRWEVGVAALLAAIAFASFRRFPARLVVAGLIGAAVLVGPWMAANRSTYGSAFYATDRLAAYARNQEIVAGERAGPPPPPDDPYGGPPTSFVEYYLHDVGLPDTARREATGTVELLRELLDGVPVPPWRGMPDGPAIDAAGLLLALATLGLAGLAVRTRSPIAARSAAVVLFAVAADGHLARVSEYRVVDWTLPCVVLLVGLGASALQDSRTQRNAVDEPAVLQ